MKQIVCALGVLSMIVGFASCEKSETKDPRAYGNDTPCDSLSKECQQQPAAEKQGCGCKKQ